MRKLLILITLTIGLIFEFVIKCSAAEDILAKTISTNGSLPIKMDYVSAVKYSIEHNNNIRAMRKNLSASEKDIGIARSSLLPKLRFNENFIATNNPTDRLSYILNQARVTDFDLSVNTLNHPPSVTNFLTAGTLEQCILDKKAVIEVKMAKKEYSANGYIFLRMQEELVKIVTIAYQKVITCQEELEIAELSKKDTQRHLSLAQARLKRGKGGDYTEVLRAESALNSKGEILNTAKRNLKIAKMNLGLFLGLENQVDVANSIPVIKFEDLSYYQKYSVNRNDIKALESKVENSKNNIKHAQAAWFPTLNAFASYNFYNNSFPFGGEGNNYFAGAVFRWDILDGNRRIYEIQKAKCKSEESKESLEWLKKNVKFKVFETYANVEEHQQNLELSIKRLNEAENTLKLVEKSWLESKVAYVSLIDAQTNLDASRENVIKNKFYLIEDLTNLAFESGIIYQEFAIN